MFNVGDNVKVVNAGALYSTYSDWVAVNADTYMEKYLQSQQPNQLKGKKDYPFGEIGAVLCTEPHGGCMKRLYLIRLENDDIFLFDGSGLEKA